MEVLITQFTIKIHLLVIHSTYDMFAFFIVLMHHHACEVDFVLLWRYMPYRKYWVLDN